MTLVHAQALWLLWLVPVVWLLAWRDRARHSRRRLLGAAVLRSLALALLVVAIAQPRTPERARGLSVVYALDVSRSVSSAFLARTLDWIRDANARYRPAETSYVVFGESATFVDSIDAVATVGVSAGDRAAGSGAIAQGATDLEAALRTAAFGFATPNARRLVLVTDGNATKGDAWRMLPRLQAEHVRVFAVPAVAAIERDAWVEAVSVPPGVRQHDPVTVRVRVQATEAMAARVRLDSGRRRLGSASVALAAGPNDVAFEVTLADAGNNVLSASIEARDDRFVANNALTEETWVAPPARVLYVEGMPESARYLADALRAHHLDVTVMSAEAMALDPGVLGKADSVVLSDLFVQNLDAKTAAALEVFVRERGGGLVFAAGESTYGQGGFAGSALEKVLPVRFEGKRKRRDLDLVLLIDRSHSMRGRKLELAKTAALSTLDLLEDRHRLAVVAFDSRPHEVVPLAPVGNKRRAEDLISGMTARGQTSLLPALQEAKRLLATSTASTKHVILLSDGITYQPLPSSADAPNAQEIHAAIMRGREETLRRDGIAPPKAESPEALPPPGAIETVVAELQLAKVTVSTVALGDKPNLALMNDIAAIGRGRSYVARSDSEIPGLFVTETRRLLGESLIEEPFKPVATHRAAVLTGLDFAAAPALRGLVVARPKAFSDVILQGPKDKPLLVATQYGLGRTVAFLSDVKNRWAADWLAWDGYGRFWAQVIRSTVPREADGELSLRVAREGPDARVQLRALDREFRFRSGLVPTVRVTSPDGTVSTLPLRPSAPGQYTARWPVASGRVTPYRFELLPGGGLTAAEARGVGPRSLTYAWSDELRGLPPDNATLRLLSEQTGGVFAPKAADIFADRGDGEWTWRPLWPFLLAAALALFLLDILWRRAPAFR